MIYRTQYLKKLAVRRASDRGALDWWPPRLGAALGRVAVLGYPTEASEDLAATRGANAAVVGILGAALYSPVSIIAVLNSDDLALALTGFIVLAVWKASPWIVVPLDGDAWHRVPR